MVNPTFQRGAASIQILGKFSRQSLGSFQCLSDFGLHKKNGPELPVALSGKTGGFDKSDSVISRLRWIKNIVCTIHILIYTLQKILL